MTDMQSNIPISSVKRILWAVDPLLTHPGLQLQTIRALGTLTKGRDVEIEPVCVISHPNIEIPIRAYSNSNLTTVGGPSVKETMSLEEALKEWVRFCRLPWLSGPKILYRELALSESVRTKISCLRQRNER